ncbi:unnamed protein product [Arabidopsis arenosa]|uniref:Uncharacterized protein n=1 Tax=Arabidopsis arenosa TaxID=38785 RepID=A0A8S2AWS3_ARAAE|nr:unnamed protein product [Arabidopsis arenosa]
MSLSDSSDSSRGRNIPVHERKMIWSSPSEGPEASFSDRSEANSHSEAKSSSVDQDPSQFVARGDTFANVARDEDLPVASRPGRLGVRRPLTLSHDRDWGSYVPLGSRWPNQALGSLVHPSSKRTPLRFTNRLPVRSMVVGKAFGLSIHPCAPNDTIITPKGPWIHPSDYRRLAHEIIRSSAIGLLAGPTPVLSIGSHRGLSRWLSVESPLVLPISDRFHQGCDV